MELRFTKLQGLGNDYLFFDTISEDMSELDWAALSRDISNRHFGVGSDGIILILPSDMADFQMRIFNADGSEAMMCGNGIRGFGKYVYDHGLTNKEELDIETRAGIKKLKLNIEAGKVVSAIVDMGKPKLKDSVTLEALGVSFSFQEVSMGNPHIVAFVKDPYLIPLEEYGPIFEKAYPDGTNVEFVAVDNYGEITMRVWERGSGITMACGTGACASMVAAFSQGVVDSVVVVKQPGGDLMISWKPGESCLMEGPAVEVFTGVYYWQEGKILGKS